MKTGVLLFDIQASHSMWLSSTVSAVYFLIYMFSLQNGVTVSCCFRAILDFVSCCFKESDSYCDQVRIVTLWWSCFIKDSDGNVYLCINIVFFKNINIQQIIFDHKQFRLEMTYNWQIMMSYGFIHILEFYVSATQISDSSKYASVKSMILEVWYIWRFV